MKDIYQFFETIKIQNGLLYNIEKHNYRLNKTIYDNFGINPMIKLQNFINPPNDNKLYRCKVIYSNKIEKINFYPYQPRDIKSFKIIKSSISYPYKYLDRSKIDKLFKKKGEADEIIIIDKSNYIKDTSIANIAIKKDNKWLTPKNPLFHGTMKQKFIEDNLLIEKNLFIEDIENIDSFAIMNAMIGFKIIKKPIFIF